MIDDAPAAYQKARSYCKRIMHRLRHNGVGHDQAKSFCRPNMFVLIEVGLITIIRYFGVLCITNIKRAIRLEIHTPLT